MNCTTTASFIIVSREKEKKEKEKETKGKEELKTFIDR